MSIRAKKSLGQNFLIDDEFSEKIAIQVPEATNIVEIGPGTGNLSHHLIRRAQKYIGIEMDRRMLPLLKNRFAAGHARFREADILKTDVASLFAPDAYHAVGNLPYYIASPILFHLLTAVIKPQSIVVMLQKEVAQRITAQHGNKNFGILSINTQLEAQARLLFHVPAKAFRPVPKVDSSVLRLQPRSWPGRQIDDRALFTMIVRKAFSQRRKMLRSALKPLPLPSIAIDYTLRPEDLSIDQWIELANAIGHARSQKPER
jgi:16S rRNA (adenine1518-N6/adenine1519-N6)-dimethyltransferase